jgi:Helix-turn-helix domain
MRAEARTEYTGCGSQCQGRARLMATITPLKHTPHTRIENSIIDNMAQIGVYGYAVYCVIKRHLNQKTGDCYPSYATIARKIGIDRGTVIRYVKKLKALNLISPLLRFKEDGSPTSNQYNFDKGGCPEPPEVVAQNNQPSSPPPPEQFSSPNKKQRTITDVDFYPTEKQKNCPHPPTEIVVLADNVTICHHCYGLLDENLKLQEEERLTVEIVAA